MKRSKKISLISFHPSNFSNPISTECLQKFFLYNSLRRANTFLNKINCSPIRSATLWRQLRLEDTCAAEAPCERTIKSGLSWYMTMTTKRLGSLCILVVFLALVLCIHTALFIYYCYCYIRAPTVVAATAATTETNSQLWVICLPVALGETREGHLERCFLLCKHGEEMRAVL